MGDLPTREKYITDNLVAATPPDDEPTCPICNENWNSPEDQIVATAECNHRYHNVCLVNWLNNDAVKSHNTCPTCRRVLCKGRTPDSDTDVDSDSDFESVDQDIQTLVALRLTGIPDWFMDSWGLEPATQLDTQNWAATLQRQFDVALPLFRQRVQDAGAQWYMSDAALKHVLLTRFLRNFDHLMSIEQWIGFCVQRRLLHAQAMTYIAPNHMETVEYILSYFDLTSCRVDVQTLFNSAHSRMSRVYVSWDVGEGQRNADVFVPHGWSSYINATFQAQIPSDGSGFIFMESSPGWIDTMVVDHSTHMVRLNGAGGQTVTFEIEFKEMDGEGFESSNAVVQMSDSPK